MCATRLSNKLMFAEWKSKFQSPTPPSKIFCLRLQPSKIAWVPASQPWFKLHVDVSDNEIQTLSKRL